jgi:hypothetical protein
VKVETRQIAIAARAWFSLIPALLSGCAVVERGSSAPEGATNTQQTPVQQSAPRIQSIENATFTGIYDEPITLDNGRWQGEPFVAGGASRPTAGLATDFYLSGDIAGDGLAEAIVILWENSGGTGSYSYVAVVGLQEGDAAVDRILSMVDLEETSWRLVRLSHSVPALQSAPVTLLIDGNRLSGQGPCNRYFAGRGSMPSNECNSSGRINALDFPARLLRISHAETVGAKISSK